MKKGWMFIALLVGVLLMIAACVGPKYVVRATGTKNQIKMLYMQEKSFLYFSWTTQGIVKCDIDNDGTLTNCREMELVFEEE